MAYALYGFLCIVTLFVLGLIGKGVFEMFSESDKDSKSANTHSQKLHLRHLAHINKE